LLVFHYLDELLLLLLCNGYFFGINFSWGHKQICLLAPTHGQHGKKKKRIWSHYGTQQSLSVCVSFPTDGIGRRFIPYWPQPNLSVSSLSVSHTHHGKKIWSL
jgi:hypothetical protein